MQFYINVYVLYFYTVGREPDLALVLTKAKKFSLRFLFSLMLGTYQVLVLFCQTERFNNSEKNYKIVVDLFIFAIVLVIALGHM